MNVEALARTIAGDTSGGLERVVRTVAWLNTNFEWSVTDYHDRTVEEIIARRAGNCAEHAKVLKALLQATGVAVRWVKEINLQPENAQRQETAARFVREMGPAASVFGLLHNDHVWLEVYDDERTDWVPADSTLNLFGLDAWVHGRLGFGSRPEAGKEMLCPFVVQVFEPDSPSLQEDRTEHYLISAFDRCHEGRLADLPAWKAWTAQIGELATLGSAAFRGEAELHQHFAKMRALLQTYEQLKSEWANAD